METKAALTGVLIQQLDIHHWPVFYLAKTQDTWCSIKNIVRKESINNLRKWSRNYQ